MHACACVTGVGRHYCGLGALYRAAFSVACVALFYRTLTAVCTAPCCLSTAPPLHGSAKVSTVPPLYCAVLLCALWLLCVPHPVCAALCTRICPELPPQPTHRAHRTHMASTHRATVEMVSARAVVVRGARVVINRLCIIAATVLTHRRVRDGRVRNIVVRGHVGAAVVGVLALPRRGHRALWLGVGGVLGGEVCASMCEQMKTSKGARTYTTSVSESAIDWLTRSAHETA